MSIFVPLQTDEYARGSAPLVKFDLSAVSPEQRTNFENACMQGLHDAQQQGMKFDQPVIIHVKPDKNNVIREFGVAGATTDEPGALQITFDPGRFSDPGFLDAVKREVTHELNHEWRTQKGHKINNLGDLLVSEGLAVIAEEAPGHAPASYTKFKDENFKQDFIRRARDNVSNKVDFGEWFFGNGSEPHYGGYILGRDIVRSYLEANNLSLTTAHDINAKNVIQDWMAGKFSISNERVSDPKPEKAPSGTPRCGQ